MTDYNKLKVAELRELLKERDIAPTGLTRKQQIIDALEENDGQTGSNANGAQVNDADTHTSTSKKRALSPSANDRANGPNKQLKKANHPAADQKVADGQIATSSKLHIPIDEGCPHASYQVYVDSGNGIIYDASLNQTNASNNNNKFYRVQLLKGPKGDYKTWTRWGRVGEHGQSATLGDGSLIDAVNHFEKKFKDKSGLRWDERGQDPKPKKYVFVQRSYLPNEEEDEPPSKSGAAQERDDYRPPECTLELPVRSLMELIFNQQYFAAAMDSLNYDANKLPLGKLSKATITQHYQLSVPGATEHLSNLYYSVIPHSFGRNRPPIELLESLTDLKDADNILKAEKDGGDAIHALDSRFQGLGMQEMKPLPLDSQEFSEINQYLLNTRGETHHVNYTVQDIFRIERQGELERFQESGYASIASDRRLLWHGSRATNFGGILGQGLRIAPPEAPVSGYMFDKGIYLADMSSKSANYCYPHISGGHAILLLCEAELGTPMQTLKHAMTGPKGWKDASCVHASLAGIKMPDTTQLPGQTEVEGASLMYNEYICYDVAQVRLRYLLCVRM
ncbi:poly polymerase catalytic domain-containing protein [Delphinella strobiligena]|nr:poly polymerase catalytic domain-containing protein [Delphinella strobiligena]